MKPRGLIQTLSDDEIIEFGRYLDKNINDSSMLLTELHGMITAIISSPRLIMPSKWQQDVLGEHVFESMEEANYVFQTLAKLQNHTISSLDNESEFDFIFYDNGTLYDISNVDEQILKCWCNGYIEGTYYDEKSWQSEEVDIATLFPFAVLGEKFSLIGQEDKDGKVIEDDKSHKEHLKKSLATIVKELNEFWKPRRFSEFDNQPKQRMKPTPKIGRNELCPCGSGRKFKKCCYLEEPTLH